MAVIVNSSSTLQDDVCATTNCGQGTCKASNTSFPGFDCECNSGWKKMQIGPLTFPPCVVPNCTFDLGCGNGAPPAPPPPPPPPSPPPPFNLFDPCNILVWCGDGTCVPNGSGHICQCNDGSANVLNATDLACFKQCYLGADCNGLVFGNSPPPPPPPSSSSAPPRNNAIRVAAPPGSTEASKSLRNLCASSMIFLAANFLTWL
ncbi:unnamed protein product [Dovyalis caffra]|uniref:EGF-like domain-containing protein n=1 Tax=Dovyalis caffra TaxID=77055 RepID=A0AAV1SV83_9ROSI|nr:unnamed protein product [Dovyalis caffra]